MKIRTDTWRYFCVILCFLCATFRQKYWIGVPKMRVKITFFQTSVFQLFMSLLYRRTKVHSASRPLRLCVRLCFTHRILAVFKVLTSADFRRSAHFVSAIVSVVFFSCRENNFSCRENLFSCREKIITRVGNKITRVGNKITRVGNKITRVGIYSRYGWHIPNGDNL